MSYPFISSSSRQSFNTPAPDENQLDLIDTRTRKSSTILWIDDDGLFLDAAQGVLLMRGFTPLMAQSAVLGLFILCVCDVDAIVVDYNMPGVNGAQFAAQIRETRPELPVFLYSDCAAEIDSDYPGLFDKAYPKGGDCLDQLIRDLGVMTRSSLQ
ncbi:MAG TPA: response regulator [Candidatus Angelobacter sp.]|nr:response regulator [Candidatus Angelobacter sp.]